MKKLTITFLTFGSAAAFCFAHSANGEAAPSASPAASAEASPHAAFTDPFNPSKESTSHPIYMIKNGRLSVTETRDGDTVVSNLTVPVVKERLEALQRQVDALKAKNAELEKALQDCKARR